jgi:CBS domain-containing protein
MPQGVPKGLGAKQPDHRVLYARDIVQTDFITLAGDVNALEAAKLMKARRHGYVVIASPEGIPVGIVTEWDYVAKVVAEGRDPVNLTLREIMSPNPVTVDDNWGIDQVSRLMTGKGIRRALVLRNGKVIGVITVKTVLSALKGYVETVSAQIARAEGPTASLA